MASLPIIEYNYYIFKPATPSSTQKKYQILESFLEYGLQADGQTLTRPSSAKFSLRWDRAFLHLYRIAYAVASVACIIATLTMAGWVLGVPTLMAVYAIGVVVISSRFIDYLERQMKNKSFEIASKVICNYNESNYLFERSEYQP